MKGIFIELYYTYLSSCKSFSNDKHSSLLMCDGLFITISNHPSTYLIYTSIVLPLTMVMSSQVVKTISFFFLLLIPTICDAQQSSFGTCTSDTDCSAVVRSRYPSNSTAEDVDMCQCYAASSKDPFDECEGETNETCAIAKCDVNSCENSVAYCDTPRWLGKGYG